MRRGRGRGGRRLQHRLPAEKARAGNVPGPPQLSNCSPAAVLPGHVSAGYLRVLPGDL